MSDTTGHEPEERLPVPRPPVEPAPVERFTSPPSVRAVELTPERAAQVVRQSSNARWVGFLTVVIVALFIAIYWFYELAPIGFTESRLDSETAAQQVTSVERGYDLIGDGYRAWSGAEGSGVRAWFLSEVLARLGPDTDVLELGCGHLAKAVGQPEAESRAAQGGDAAGQLPLALPSQLPDKAAAGGHEVLRPLAVEPPGGLFQRLFRTGLLLAAHGNESMVDRPAMPGQAATLKLGG